MSFLSRCCSNCIAFCIRHRLHIPAVFVKRQAARPNRFSAFRMRRVVRNHKKADFISPHLIGRQCCIRAPEADQTRSVELIDLLAVE